MNLNEDQRFEAAVQHAVLALLKLPKDRTIVELVDAAQARIAASKEAPAPKARKGATQEPSNA